MAIFRPASAGRQAHPAVAGLKILNVFPRLKSSPSLTLQKISHSRTASKVL